MPVGFPDYYGGLTLPVTVQEGGTGQTSITANAMLYGAGTSKLVETNVGTAGQILQINAATLLPTFQNLTIDATASPFQISGSATDLTMLTLIDSAAGGGNFEIDLHATGTASVLGAGSISLYDNVASALRFGIKADGTPYFSVPLPVGSGGTSTATPTLTAGTGISITGTWPDNTITNSSNYAALADPLPVAHGGTGTTTPALVAGTGISITGNWPSNTITNSSAYAALADPLPVAHGGTGTTTPALVGGSNISISGTWPDQTVALAANVSTATLTLQPAADGTTLLSGKNLATTTVIYIIDNASGNGEISILNSNTTVGVHLYGNITGSVAQFGSSSLVIDATGILTKYNNVALAGVGLPSIVAKLDLTGQTAGIASTTLFTPSTAGMYRICGEYWLTGGVGSSSLSVLVTWTQNGVALSKTFLATGPTAGPDANGDGFYNLYADSGTAIKYTTSYTLGGSGDSYDIHIRLERI